MIFRLTAAVAAVAPLPGMAQESSDIAREKDLQEVTITSRSVQKRMDEVQIGVEKGQKYPRSLARKILSRACNCCLA